MVPKMEEIVNACHVIDGISDVDIKIIKLLKTDHRHILGRVGQ